MTEQKMRELDAWILLNIGWTNIKWKEAGRDGNLYWLSGFYGNGPEGKSYSEGGFCSNPLAFAKVKREIEKRGWSWESSCFSRAPKDLRYRFTVFTQNWETDGCMNAETEELAGCLAFREALRASVEKETDDCARQED